MRERINNRESSIVVSRLCEPWLFVFVSVLASLKHRSEELLNDQHLLLFTATEFDVGILIFEFLHLILRCFIIFALFFPPHKC